jgi:hypothetical protein
MAEYKEGKQRSNHSRPRQESEINCQLRDPAPLSPSKELSNKEVQTKLLVYRMNVLRNVHKKNRACLNPLKTEFLHNFI